MILIITIVLYAFVIIVDFIPNYIKYKDKKKYSITYILVLVITFSVVSLRIFGVELITTYDVIRLFGGS